MRVGTKGSTEEDGTACPIFAFGHVGCKYDADVDKDADAGVDADADADAGVDEDNGTHHAKEDEDSKIGNQREGGNDACNDPLLQNRKHRCLCSPLIFCSTFRIWSKSLNCISHIFVLHFFRETAAFNDPPLQDYKHPCLCSPLIFRSSLQNIKTE